MARGRKRKNHTGKNLKAKRHKIYNSNHGLAKNSLGRFTQITTSLYQALMGMKWVQDNPYTLKGCRAAQATPVPPPILLMGLAATYPHHHKFGVSERYSILINRA